MSYLKGGGAVVGGGSRLGALTEQRFMTKPFDPDLLIKRRRLATETSGFQGFRRRVIRGVTRDSTGAVLGTCVVHCLRTIDDFEVDQTISDGAGLYECSVYDDMTYYLVGYKTGSPDVTGATLNTIAGS